MSPRSVASWLLLAVRILVLSLLIVAVFWLVAFLLTMAAGWVRGVPVAGAGLLPRCALCGLIAGLFVAVFHLKRESVVLPVGRREEFLGQLWAELKELGYVPAAGRGDRLAFRPSFRSFLLGTGIKVRLDGASATLTGPRVYLEVLRRRLRLQGYIHRVDRAGQGMHTLVRQAGPEASRAAVAVD